MQCPTQTSMIEIEKSELLLPVGIHNIEKFYSHSTYKTYFRSLGFLFCKAALNNSVVIC